jgi:hypothetical protein
MKFVLLESLLNLEANHALSFEIWKSFICILIKGNITPINAIFGKTIIWSKQPYSKIIKSIWLAS